MLALQYTECGEPDVLHLGEEPEPHAGRGQVRIAVRAASVNAFDWKVRAGLVPGMPRTFPATPGIDGAGVVDEVGDGVTDIEVGDRVFGLGSRTFAELAVLNAAARMPDSMSFEEAGALGVVVEAAARALDLLDVAPGANLLIDGAAGGVGSAAVQFAVARGLAVVGTASRAHHDYLRTLGATPTTYGPGLPARVAALVPEGFDAAVDVVGKGSVPELIEITGDPSRVVTVADFGAASLGVTVADSSRGRATYALAEAARLYDAGRFVVEIEQVFPLADGAAAHRLSQAGHVRGKVVVTVPGGPLTPG
jgi:NADPH:quinone reductase-like Zn-dependent oxidoreductase